MADKETVAYIVGVALGDGNLSRPNHRCTRLRISCDTKYPQLIEKILEEIVGWKVGSGSKFIQVVRVPKWIMDDRDCLIQCLSGLLETDGCVYMDRGYKMVVFVSIIPELAQDVADMMVYLGFKPRIYRVVPKSIYNNKPRYNVRLSKNVEEFLKIVPVQKQ